MCHVHKDGMDSLSVTDFMKVLCRPTLAKDSRTAVFGSYNSETGNCDAALQRLTALDIKTDKQPKSNT